ncbi:MAG: SDR family NAD(P)-dependent oxidoreductase [Paludisphaera borealis]|uniref:SDR family NAD(P)-dependent oxidoreductase n=1 Tax=Paludisphaera borealis TaxID=1387353 RepID=UPI00284D0B68|nr:SDR family NAD(P)-dependent oxidoreductase [Paludisphaera borealis]MDR3622912.1 SDR family NAD(P)-dependent oxidoreductase [Paludisphaera borealis]
MVVVTGASSGIGRALAIELGAGGCRLGLIARRGPELQETAALVRAQGGEAHAATADVGDRQALREAIGAVEEALGPAQVLVANAGFGAPTRLDPLNIDDVERTFRVNVMGVIYSVEAVLPGMLARGDGHLVAVSSLAALKGLPGESAYCASKAAVNTYMEGLRIALRSRGVAVATVCPGFVDTLIEPMDAAATPFLISAEVAAKKIARVIDARKSGVVAFPWMMAALTALIARLPDFLVARLVGEGGVGP